MADFELNWTPGAGVDSQNAQYRQKGDIDWISTINLDPVNPLAGAAVTVDANGLNDNTVYEFRIQSIDAGKTPGYSTTKEKINFDCPADTKEVRGSTINIHFGEAYPTIDKMYFGLHIAASEVVVDTAECTGTEAYASFTGVAAGTYFITFYMETLIDGVNTTSIDQTGDWCSTTNVVVT